MRIACLQLAVGDEPRAERMARALALLEGARGCDLVMLPELWATGYFSFDRYAAEAEALDGPTVSSFAAHAAQLRFHLHLGSIIELRAGRLHNTSVLIGPDGRVIASYRKMHLFGHQSDEARLLTRGDEVVVADAPWGRTGLSTCYDLRFPELYRAQLDLGAGFFLVASAWPQARVEAWRLFTRARAHENLGFLVACNCAGSNGGRAYAGRSVIVAPTGEIVAEAGDGEELLIADIDPGEVASARAEFSALRDRVLTRGG